MATPLLAAACSAPVVDDVADASGIQTQAIVHVDRVVTADGAIQSNVSAKFMRQAAGSDREATERLVGARLDLPNLGECRTFGGADDAATLAAMGPTELLDVGDVTIRASGATIPLAARAFPDVGGALVSGVFYSSRDRASDLPTASRYELDVSGGSSAGRFSAEFDAPAPPEEVTLTELDPAGEPHGARLRWQPGADVVYVDVASPASDVVVRCLFPDSGEATVPAQILAVFASPTASLETTVHRLRRASFVAAGVDSGEVRFDLAVVARLVNPAR